LRRFGRLKVIVAICPCSKRKFSDIIFPNEGEPFCVDLDGMLIRLTALGPVGNMNRFYAMQLGNWVTNLAQGQAANLVRSVIKNTEDCSATPQSAL
jgi:hypothetical protein